MYTSVKPGQIILQVKDLVLPFVKGLKYIVLQVNDIRLDNLHVCYVGSLPYLEHRAEFFINRDFKVLDEIVNTNYINELKKKDIILKLEDYLSIGGGRGNYHEAA